MKNKFIIPVLKPESYLRKILCSPQGTLYIGKYPIKDLEAHILVGDIVSNTLRGNIRIIDYKTRRRINIKSIIKKPLANLVNPRGTMSLMSRTIAKAKKYRTIIVKGEEDLVTLAYALENNETSIAYGQPDIGVVIIKNNRFKALRILKTFKPDIVVYNKV
ncbi:DUF359 domain-containing protein [Staphylothermus hellenicus]|uniref:DPCK n=1 Tax=Staphylothermus hellenicus (strain DSM 12710 / JCM 10830 / BK20S6-10-b1 / P8) TaxID=591019 RepID=D7DAC1_STAHD|nr:DUF359 domain-containing protein [Staphylothermus hellenicus]ADI32717.1 Protein of unknown function DUF359 [Staphylothermus hellenicus DSM 12710]